ncbi:sodium-dependent transporter [Salinisphaera sp.]|uniref:sodium-dependent transporter n=1 Tax=Salinisphaera sp. TaxID=1914330 RepID=UPI000C414DE9|nr:sodium-dependent transporter [Salinisphaera sp.]MBS63821.1 sodium-dependent transporter [Salinisphaera sp.]
MTVAREHWGSRLGFIMASAGSAVGLGNVWKFPYMAGENGGGAFLIIYLGCVVFFGFALVMAELLIGRMTQSNPVGAFRKLGGRGWPMVGAMGVLTAFIILSFYIVVAGWTLAYILFMGENTFSGLNIDESTAIFNGFVAAPIQPLIYAAIFTVLMVGVVLGGVASGIERASKWLMPLLFVLLVVLAIRAVSLPGAGDGVAFYLMPDWSRVTASTWGGAISQAFFSLSLGMGAMLTYGSYMSREQNLPRDASLVVGLDTLVALLAGLVILPAVFSAGMEPSAGAGLTFMTLPTVFAEMPAGAIFGLAFFVLLAIAALTSAVSLLEVVVSYLVDDKGFTRATAASTAGVVIFLLGIPISLSQGVWKEITIAGMTFLDFADFLTAQVMMPIGGLLIALFVGWRLGPRAVEALKSHPDQRLPLAGLWLFILRFVAPLGIAWILAQGLFE